MTPERRRDLEERRDFLLSSIDDLEREHDAGDMTEADFNLLHRDYSARAAAVLRELEAAGHTARSAPAPPSAVDRAIAKKAKLLKLAAVAGIAVFAMASGLFVAKIAGVRQGNLGPTGGIDAAQALTTTAKVEELLRKGRDNLATEPQIALEAFDEATALDPTRVEAWAYGGWILRLVAGSASEANRDVLIGGALKRINKALEIDPSYADARAFRAIISLRDLNDPKAALEDFAALDNSTIPDEVSALIGNARVDAEAALREG